MKKFVILIVSVVSLFLSGCAPSGYDVKPNLTNNSYNTDDNSGYVLFSDFDIPQRETRQYNRSDMPVENVKLYDITGGQIVFIGYLPTFYFTGSQSGREFGNFVEYKSPLGFRTFMLSSIGSTDFIQVMVTSLHKKYISVSFKYPEPPLVSNKLAQALLPDFRMLRTSFTEVKFDDQHFDYCSHLKGSEEDVLKNIDQYMQSNHISSRQKYFRSYCLMIAHPHSKVMSLNEDGHKWFSENKTSIEQLKAKEFPTWLKRTNKNPVFHILQPIF